MNNSCLVDGFLMVSECPGVAEVLCAQTAHVPVELPAEPPLLPPALTHHTLLMELLVVILHLGRAVERLYAVGADQNGCVRSSSSNLSGSARGTSWAGNH